MLGHKEETMRQNFSQEGVSAGHSWRSGANLRLIKSTHFDTRCALSVCARAILPAALCRARAGPACPNERNSLSRDLNLHLSR